MMTTWDDVVRFVTKWADRELAVWVFLAVVTVTLYQREPPLLPSAASENERIWSSLIFHGERVASLLITGVGAIFWARDRMRLKAAEAQAKASAGSGS